MRYLFVAVILGALVSGACGDRNTVVNVPTAPGAPVGKALNSIEFRVSGTALSTKVRFSDPVDGLTQVVTGLPYVVDTATNQSEIFLSLEVTPLSFSFAQSPFLSAQIFVNNVLFREASSVDMSTDLSVSGTWRSF